MNAQEINKAIAIECGLLKPVAKFRNDKGKMVYCCPACGSRNIKVWDCGYSSFNVGGVKCEQCNYEVNVDCCGCFPTDELIVEWNKAAKKQNVPNYFSDLNACHEAEKTLQCNIADYEDNLSEICHGSNINMICATAPQRCEAFLRTVNPERAKELYKC